MFSLRRTKSLIGGVALAVAATLSLGAQDAEKINPNPDALAKKLIAIKSFQAKFKQVVITQNGDTEISQSGRVFFDRRGDFRWEVTDPFKQDILVSGDTMRVYDPELEQMTISSFDASDSANFASLILSPSTDTLNDFDIEREQDQFILYPKGSGHDFVQLKVTFTEESLSSIEILDHFDSINQFKFVGAVTNSPIGREQFTITVPEDTEIVDQRIPSSNSISDPDE